MKISPIVRVAAVLLTGIVSSDATTLSVNSSNFFSNGLYNYGYNFTVTGGNADNIYLGSGDLSPLSLTILFDNAATTGWSWLGNSTSQNYLQFFRAGGSLLTPADSLSVTFISSIPPIVNSFAVAFNSATAEASPYVNNVIAPGPAAIPEPGSFALAALAGAAMLAVRRLRFRG